MKIQQKKIFFGGVGLGGGGGVDSLGLILTFLSRYKYHTASPSLCSLKFVFLL